MEEARELVGTEDWTPIERFELIISQWFPGFTVPVRKAKTMNAESSGKSPSSESTCKWTVRQGLLRAVVKMMDEILQIQVDMEYFNSLPKNKGKELDLSDNQAAWTALNKTLCRLALCQNCEQEWEELEASLRK